MVCVVGCNHGIQPRDPDWLGGDTPEVKKQKVHFTELLEEITKEGKIGFVGEEWGLPAMTIAHALADKYGATWANINTSLGDLKQMGIPCDYEKRPVTHEQKESWHRQREQVMFSKICGNKGDAQNLLILCGFDHLQPLSDLLRKIDSAVNPRDYRKLDWYRAGVFPEDP